MKSNDRIELAVADEIATDVLGRLAPFCERIAVAGSVRRRCPDVGDIEVVAIPLTEQVGLWADCVERHHGFREVVNSWARVKGDATGKYTQRLLSSGVKLDLFMATPRNWGLIMAIRTGSAEYSHRVLAAGWVRNGYMSVDGHLCRQGRQVDTPEEEDVFRLAGVDWVSPEFRRWP